MNGLRPAKICPGSVTLTVLQNVLNMMDLRIYCFEIGHQPRNNLSGCRHLRNMCHNWWLTGYSSESTWNTRKLSWIPDQLSCMIDSFCFAFSPLGDLNFESGPDHVNETVAFLALESTVSLFVHGHKYISSWIHFVQFSLQLTACRSGSVLSLGTTKCRMDPDQAIWPK